MKQSTPLAALLALLLTLTACGAADTSKGSTDSDKPALEESAPEKPTLESLFGEDYQSYLAETITMQMGNRMDKTPDICYFPIANDAPLTNYAAIDETTSFELEENGNIVIYFAAGTVADEASGEQSFRIPKP